MIKQIIGLLIFILLLGFVSAQADSNHTFSEKSIFYAIDQDYDAGVISLDDKVILQIKAIKTPDKLPLKYVSLSAGVDQASLREATIALIEIRLNWEYLKQDTKDYALKALARIPTTFSYVTSSGYFKLHYDTLGTDAVPTADTNSNLIPDFIEKCASYCDTSLNVHLDLGFIYPPSDGGMGGDTLFDVYFQEMGYYGYAVPEAPGDYAWNDYYSYMVMNNDFIGFPSNNDPEGDIAGAAKSTAAHEFHHCVQFAYDISEGSWFMELDATYMEDIVFDAVDDNYNYLSGFMDSPQTSLMDNSPGHKYASFIWAMYLAENFDTTLNVAVWEGARYASILDTYADSLETNYNWSIDSAYVDFTYWNFCTSTRDDGLHYEEAANYPLISIGASYSSYPVSLSNSPSNVSGYAESYIAFYPGSEIGKLKITFNGSNTREWAAYIIKSTTINSHEIEFILLDTLGYLGEIVIPEFENYYSVTLVAVNTEEFSSGVLYTYAAEIVLPFEVSTNILTADSAVYSGGARSFDFQVINKSVLNDIFHVIYWDDQGWLPIDTFSLAISSGDSEIVAIEVTPPQGSPLSQISNLYFKAESWGDSTVFDQKTKKGQIFLQRGDLDFSGHIDIADIVYFVEFSFNGGASPQPVLLSADFDCTDDVNIADLVALVSYSFNSGDYSPCNPY